MVSSGRGGEAEVKVQVMVRRDEGGFGGGSEVRARVMVRHDGGE